MNRKFLLLLLAFALVLIFNYQKHLVKEWQFQEPHQIVENASSPLPQLINSYIRPVTNSTGNLPDIYLTNQKKPSGQNKTCARYPDLFDLRFTNDHWQTQRVSDGIFHLLNAYVDDRNGTKVRIIAIHDVWRTTKKYICQFWYEQVNQPDIVTTEEIFWIFSQKWGADKGYFMHPYLITCPIVLKNNQLPTSVSLVENACDSATNNLKIFSKKLEQKKNFVVCVKGLSFPFQDKGAVLAEWFEVLRILGADKINLYEFSAHPNTQKILDYYVDQGLLELTPLTLVGGYSNLPLLQNIFLHKKVTHRRLQEVIPYNDCLYKHLGEFKYVVLLDNDEVIVPAEDTWNELMSKQEEIFSNATTHIARNVYFFDNLEHQHDWFEGIPKYMHMLQHIYRSPNYTKPGHFVKGFHKTSSVVALHNHYPFKCLGNCQHKDIDVKLAHLQHYRADCVAGVKDCMQMKENVVVDDRLWRFKDELIDRVTRTLRLLGFIANT